MEGSPQSKEEKERDKQLRREASMVGFNLDMGETPRNEDGNPERSAAGRMTSFAEGPPLEKTMTPESHTELYDIFYKNFCLSEGLELKQCMRELLRRLSIAENDISDEDWVRIVDFIYSPDFKRNDPGKREQVLSYNPSTLEQFMKGIYKAEQRERERERERRRMEKRRMERKRREMERNERERREREIYEARALDDYGISIGQRLNYFSTRKGSWEVCKVVSFDRRGIFIEREQSDRSTYRQIVEWDRVGNHDVIRQLTPDRAIAAPPVAAAAAAPAAGGAAGEGEEQGGGRSWLGRAYQCVQNAFSTQQGRGIGKIKNKKKIKKTKKKRKKTKRRKRTVKKSKRRNR